MKEAVPPLGRDELRNNDRDDVVITREDLDRRLNMPIPTYTYAGEEFLIYELSQLLNLPPTRIADETQMAQSQ